MQKNFPLELQNSNRDIFKTRSESQTQLGIPKSPEDVVKKIFSILIFLENGLNCGIGPAS